MYTLADLPRHGAALHGPRTAVVFEGSRLTYAELNQRVNQAAHVLIGLGVNPRERIAILADNCASYLEIYLAAAKLGVIEHCHSSLAGYKCPKKISFMASQPKTVVGKISGKTIKELVL